VFEKLERFSAECRKLLEFESPQPQSENPTNKLVLEEPLYKRFHTNFKGKMSESNNSSSDSLSKAAGASPAKSNRWEKLFRTFGRDYSMHILNLYIFIA
jgi:hypothetical protein